MLVKPGPTSTPADRETRLKDALLETNVYSEQDVDLYMSAISSVAQKVASEQFNTQTFAQLLADHPLSGAQYSQSRCAREVDFIWVGAAGGISTVVFVGIGGLSDAGFTPHVDSGLAVSFAALVAGLIWGGERRVRLAVRAHARR